ncbi:MAG: carboxymuconolactone decarboxylase family protein [Terriglobia bacterium]
MKRRTPTQDEMKLRAARFKEAIPAKTRRLPEKGAAEDAIVQQRMADISANKMTAAQKKAADEFLRERGKPPMGPFVPLLRSPEVMLCVKALGDYLRFKSPLPPNLRELAILITVREWAQRFQWHYHSELAIKAGVSPEIVQAVAEGRRPARLSGDEEIVCDFCTELLHNHSVSDATYDKAIAKLGEQNTIDMVSLTGYYAFNAMVLNVNRTPPPKGASAAPVFFPK